MIVGKRSLQIDPTTDSKAVKLEELRKLMGGPAASRLLGKNTQSAKQDKKGVVKVCLERIS